MAEEEMLQQPINPEVRPEDRNLLAEFEEYKKNSVSKDEYDRLMERNKELAHNWAHNTAEQAKKEDPDTIESLRQELFSENRREMTNLETASKMLKLREKTIESGKPDPFLSSSTNANYSQSEVDAAERVAAGLQNMVDEADGDAAYFNTLLEKQVGSPNMRIRK